MAYIPTQLDNTLAKAFPVRDIEAQLPVAEDSINPATPPNSSPRLLESYDIRRDSSATTILPPAGTTQSRRPSVINETKSDTSPPESDGATTSSPTHAWWHAISKPVVQMLIAAALAVIIGIVVAATVEHVPDAARALLAIPGDLWLRALKCIGTFQSQPRKPMHVERNTAALLIEFYSVVPLILSSLILAVQRLKQMSGHGALIAKWTLGYYLSFMLFAIAQSTATSSLLWSRLFVRVESAVADPGNSTGTTATGGANTTEVPPHEVVVQVFESLIPENIVEAIAADQRLLSVMVIALAIGYLLRPTSMFVRVVTEVEELVAAAVAFLIRLAPIGVFFLVLPNLFILPLRDIGTNLGVLIGACLAGMFIHLFIIISAFYLLVARENPYAFLLRIAPAWTEAWGSGSSAATLPVTMECVIQQKVPLLVTKFVVPLGVLINMDGWVAPCASLNL